MTPIKPFEVGTKVRVSKEYLNLLYKLATLSKLAKSQEVVTIEKVFKTDYGSLLYVVDNISIDHRLLIPVLEEEKFFSDNELDKAFKKECLKMGKKNGWIKDGEVIE